LLWVNNVGVFKRGKAPLFNISSPSPSKERGIKGVRVIIFIQAYLPI